MAARELSEAHDGDGNDGAAARSACAGERGVREWEWSSRDVALLSVHWPDRLGHHRHTSTTWRACPGVVGH